MLRRMDNAPHTISFQNAAPTMPRNRGPLFLSTHVEIMIKTCERPRRVPVVTFHYDLTTRLDFGHILIMIAREMGLHYKPEVDGRLQFLLEGRKWNSRQRVKIEKALDLFGDPYDYAVLKRARKHLDFICGVDVVHVVHGVNNDTDEDDETSRRRSRHML